jgi:hypothetical protein
VPPDTVTAQRRELRLRLLWRQQLMLLLLLALQRRQRLALLRLLCTSQRGWSQC